MAERNELAVFGNLVACLLAKFAQCHLLDCFCARSDGFPAVMFRRLPKPSLLGDPGYSRVDLARGRFPDGFADRDAFLANEDNFAVARDRRNDDGRFAMHNCPRVRLASRWCSDAISYDVEVCVGKVPLARDDFPPALLHPERL